MWSVTHSKMRRGLPVENRRRAMLAVPSRLLPTSRWQNSVYNVPRWHRNQLHRCYWHRPMPKYVHVLWDFWITRMLKSVFDVYMSTRFDNWNNNVLYTTMRYMYKTSNNKALKQNKALKSTAWLRSLFGRWRLSLRYLSIPTPSGRGGLRCRRAAGGRVWRTTVGTRV